MAETIDFACANCGTKFSYPAWRVREYRKKFSKDPAYCSRKCWGLATSANNAKRAVFSCEECGKVTRMRRYIYLDKTTGKPHSSTYVRKQRFCSQACAITAQRRASANKFLTGETGRHLRKDGYARIIRPIAINGKREPVYEHRVVMSRIIGRPLRSDEHCHHINGIRSDNRPENLELWTKQHPPGKRVADIISFAIDMLRLYPEFAAEAGVKLIDGERDH